MKIMHWFIIIILMLWGQSFPAEVLKMKKTYYPMFFVRGVGEDHFLYYYDLDEDEMVYYKKVRFSLVDCWKYNLSNSLDGEYLAVHNCAPRGKRKRADYVQEMKFRGLKIIDLETGNTKVHSLKNNTFNAGPGVFTQDYYTYPVYYLIPKRERKKKLRELKKEGRISHFFNESEFNTLMGDCTKLSIHDLSSNKIKFMEFPEEDYTSSGYPEMGIFLNKESENLMYVEIRKDPFVLDLDKNRWREYESENSTDHIFHSLHKVYKNQNSEQNIIWKTPHRIVDITPDGRKVMYSKSMDRQNVYVKDLKSGQNHKIQIIDIEAYRRLPIQAADPDVLMHQFTGWIRKESVSK